MGATIIQRERETRPDGVPVEMVAWLVEPPVPGNAHGYKYRLYAGSVETGWGINMRLEKHFPTESVKDEFRVWTQIVKPELQLSANVLNICEYGVTEILNNVIDHSKSNNLIIRGEQDSQKTTLEIEDDGIGVFARLRAFFDFDSDIHALIELVKGKLTIAPDQHSGEGLFFASKVFDLFVIQAGELSVSFVNNQCEVRFVPSRVGTLLHMEIANNSKKTMEQTFNQFSDSGDRGFYRTRFFLSLAALEGNLVSRSQAKRVAARFEQFSEVELDFSGVHSIGQAFADELFRVWPLSHLHTNLQITNANEAVLKMCRHIKGRIDLPQLNASNDAGEKPPEENDGGDGSGGDMSDGLP